jgi:predicted Zn-dependent protease
MSNRTLWGNFKKNLALLNKDNFTEFQEIVKYIIENLNVNELRNEEYKYLSLHIRQIELFFLNWSSDWEEYVRIKDTEEFRSFISNGDHLFEIPEIKVNIQGFTCIFVDAKEDQIENAIAKIEKTLDRINKTAKKYLPLVLKYKVPLYFSFGKTVFCTPQEQTHSTVQFQVDGCYSSDRKVIEILYLENTKPNALSGVIAHELGHHIFRNYLSDKAQEFWYDIVNGVTENLTIRKVFGESDNYVETIKDAYRTPKTLTNYQSLRDKQIFIKKLELDLDIDFSRVTKEQLHYLIYQNLDTPIRIHKVPMTVYANANPEEAFCEFLRILFQNQLFMIDRSWRKYFEIAMGTRIQNKLAKSIHTYKFK